MKLQCRLPCGFGTPCCEPYGHDGQCLPFVLDRDFVVPCEMCDERATRLASTGPAESRRAKCPAHRDEAIVAPPRVENDWIRDRELSFEEVQREMLRRNGPAPR